MINHNEKYHPDLILKSNPCRSEGQKLIAIGASTGGVEAISKIIQMLPPNLPPIVITQHIPEGFSTSFANRLNRLAVIDVFEANEKMHLHNSCAYLAPGGKHLLLDKVGNDDFIKSVDGERIWAMMVALEVKNVMTMELTRLHKMKVVV